MWKEFVPDEISVEFRLASGLGAEVLRCFLLWEDFQPDPDSVSAEALDKLECVLDTASRHGLLVMVTVFQGNMSGAFWWPHWALGEAELEAEIPQVSSGQLTLKRVRDLFADEGMVKAERVLLHCLGRRFRKHSALWGWDLANELDQAVSPRSSHEGELWMRRMVEALRETGDSHPVTYGAHLPSLAARNGFQMDAMARALDVVSFHVWTIYTPFAEGPADLDTALFLYNLATDLAGRPVLVQEFGLPTTRPGEGGRTIKDMFLDHEEEQYLASEEEQADFVGRFLEAFYLAGAAGAMVWCLFDFGPELWERVPYDRCVRERSFGLVRSDLSLKPAAQVFGQFARDLREGRLPRPGALRRSLGISADWYYRDPEVSLQHALRLWRR
jgi:endo-1,4-beta-mannosidase